MRSLLVFGLRVALAASYLTLAVAQPGFAADLAPFYAAAVLAVAVVDFRAARRKA